MSGRIEPSSIPVDAYLKYALSLTPKEKELIKEFSKWLPNEIVDAHVHSNLRSHCNFIDRDYFSRPSSTFPWFEISKHMRVNRILYPKKEVKMLVFPVPFRGVNHRAANDYITRQAARNPLIVPILYGLPDHLEYTISALKTGKFYGLKMYPAYFSPRAQKIYEYFLPQVLKYCEEKGIPIILHLPHRVVECKEELTVIAKKFPNLTIVLAHSGLAHLLVKDFQKTLRLLSKYENIYLDTAAVTSVKVFEITFDIFGYHRVIYGTDQPLNLIKGKMCYNSNFGIRVATKYLYHWVNLEEQRKLSQYIISATHLHWETLLALQKAIQLYGESKDIKNCIFRENAKRVFGLS
jgi:predicted TIM-barrel fold metal-dependent hydrolase